MARNKFDVDEELEAPFQLSHLKRVLVYVKPYAWKMVIALIISAVTWCLSLLGTKIFQWTLDIAIPNKDIRMVLQLALLNIIATALILGLVVVRGRLMAHVSNYIICDIRRDLFAHLQKLPFAYYDSRPAGKILVRVINYVNSVSNILTNGIVNTIIELIGLVLIAIFMFMTNVRLSLVIVAGLPVFLFFVFLIKPMQRKAWQRCSNKSANYNAFLAESIDGVRVSQLFSRQEENKSIMERLSQACRHEWLRALYISHSVWFSSQFVTQTVFCFLYVTGVYWLSGSMVSFGVIMAMGDYVNRFWGPITNLANIYNDFVNNLAYLERIMETMDEPVDIDDAPDAVELPKITGELSFNHVTFGYEPGIHILEDFNLHVKPGESIALVGETGAGKTTVVNLISRFYDIESGSIDLYADDGSGVRPYGVSAVTLNSLRRQLGIMMQDSFIFSGTILDNIRYGRLDATEEEIVAAAKAVCAHDFISKMPNGYYTEVSERGGSLSQGQRQMISFARTLLSDPAILILDEATSSIDTKTERLLQQGIAKLLEGRTSFIIAHRLSTIKNCDQILVIGNKGILESGTHDELMERKGAYYQLSTAQK
ncbi:MAG: ABC transporter ATP-binding protein [Clostridia bacterium]|nr:ABC transporter ATP-binding protein [Clostridia bacterium]